MNLTTFRMIARLNIVCSIGLLNNKKPKGGKPLTRRLLMSNRISRTESLTHFWPMSLFYSPTKHSDVFRGIKWKHWPKIG